jgi:hypothetical protein
MTIKNKDGKGRMEDEGGKIGSAVIRAAAGLTRSKSARFGKRALRRQKREKTTENLVLGYDDDSRFSAISSILVTEFQLRPVPGVFRIL